MKSIFVICSAVLLYVAVSVQPSFQKTDCEKKRDNAEQLVRQQAKNQSLGLAILVPRCTATGEYEPLQCHHNSNFCMCVTNDEDGLPLTQPKKNLRKCGCMTERAKALKSIPPSQTDIPEITSCEPDGAYTKKQCNRTSCFCVNPETGKKAGPESKDKNKLQC